MANTQAAAADLDEDQDETYNNHVNMMESVGVDIIDEMEILDETENEPEDKHESQNGQDDAPVNEEKTSAETFSHENDQLFQEEGVNFMESVGVDIIDEMEILDETEAEAEDKHKSLNRPDIEDAPVNEGKTSAETFSHENDQLFQEEGDPDIQEGGPLNEAKTYNEIKSNESDDELRHEEEEKERLIANSLGSMLSLFIRKGNSGAQKTETLQGQHSHGNSSDKNDSTGTDGINEAAADVSTPVGQKSLMEDKEQVEDQAAKETKTDDSNLEETASDSKSVICQKEENDSVKDKNESIADEYGSYIKVTLSGFFLCEVCLSEMNGLPSLALHVSGMKHLKRVAVYEKNKALICADGRNLALQEMQEQKNSNEVKSKDNMTKSNNRNKRDEEREKIRYRKDDRSRDRERVRGQYRGTDTEM
nr:uncharacterized protein LOC113809479 [Penaeus vannamei]